MSPIVILNRLLNNLSFMVSKTKVGIAIGIVVIIIAIVLTILYVYKPTRYVKPRHVVSINKTITSVPKVITKVKVVTPRAELIWQSPILISRSWLIRNGIYYRVWTWWTFFEGYVTVSPDGKYVVVGTVKGELYIFNADTGSLIKKIVFPLGEIPRTIRFTPDGKYMIVGVWCRRGILQIYDTKTWKIVWSLELDKFVKGPSNATVQTIIKNPWLGVVPYYIVLSPNGSIIYVTVVERYVNPKTQYAVYTLVRYDLAKIYPEIAKKYRHYYVTTWTSKYWSRIVAIDIVHHRVVWVWPREHPAYIDIPILAISRNGRYLAAASFWGVYAKNPVEYHMGKVWVIDAYSGKTLYTFSPTPPIPYINHTTIWNGLSFADNGKYLIVVTGEGRIYVLDNLKSIEEKRPVIVWKRSIVQFLQTEAIMIPLHKGLKMKIVKTYIYTYAGLAAVTDKYVIVYTGSTYSVGWTPGYLKRPIELHPNSTKLFVFTLNNGDLVYIDCFYGEPTYGKVRPFVLTGCYLVGSIGINWVSRDASLSGVYVWDVCGKPRRVLRILTVLKGLGIPVDVSAYDSKIFILTGLVNTAKSPTQPMHIVGEYRLRVYKIVTS